MRTSPSPKNTARSNSALQRVEDALLALLLLAMILLASLQIVLRDLFGGGIAWADPALRALVLWVGLLGAVAASRDDRHISVDMVSRLLPKRMRAVVGTLTHLFTAAVSGLIAYHSARFVASEFEYESVAFSGVPAWMLQSVIPFAFAAIALRSLRRAGEQLRTARHAEPPNEAGTDAGAESGAQ